MKLGIGPDGSDASYSPGKRLWKYCRESGKNILGVRSNIRSSNIACNGFFAGRGVVTALQSWTNSDYPPSANSLWQISRLS